MTKHVALNAILALGMLFVILKGGIDLSVGSTLGLSGVVAGVLLQGFQLDVFGVVALSGRLGRRARLPRGRHAGRARQRHPDHPVQCRALHRDVGDAVRRARRCPADLERIDLPAAQGSAELGNTGFNLIGGSRPLGHPDLHLDHGRARHRSPLFVLRKTPFGRSVYAVGRKRARCRARRRAGEGDQARRLHDQRLLCGDRRTHHSERARQRRARTPA